MEDIRRVIELDVRDYPPPEPLRLIIAELSKLPPEHRLRVIHRQEPCQLFPWLRDRGLPFVTETDLPGKYIMIIG